MKVAAIVVLIAGLSVSSVGVAGANEYSCAHAAAANGYVTASKFLWQIEQDCATAYKIAYPGGIDTPEQAKAASEAADQYLRTLGYDVETVEQMDIAGHGY